MFVCLFAYLLPAQIPPLSSVLSQSEDSFTSYYRRMHYDDYGNLDDQAPLVDSGGMYFFVTSVCRCMLVGSGGWETLI